MTPLHGNLLRFCPYCRARGDKGESLKIWQTRSVTSGYATRWTRCEGCNALWREVYSWEKHHFEYAEHWKPAS